MQKERLNEAMPKKLELALMEFAYGYLEKGRKDWDIPHTKAVKYYAEEIARAEGLDVLVHKTVAILHDIGYYAAFAGEESEDYDKVQDRKILHMEYGKRLAREVLERPEVSKFYTEAQKELIIELIGIHDRVDRLSTPDEIAFMEADTLGAIDIQRVKPTFNYENGMKYIEGSLKGKRVPKFRTEKGKEFLAILLPKFEEYIKSLQK